MIVNYVAYDVTQPAHIAVIAAVEGNFGQGGVRSDPDPSPDFFAVPMARVFPSGQGIWVSPASWAFADTNYYKQMKWASHDAYNIPLQAGNSEISGTYDALLTPLLERIRMVRGAILIALWFGFAAAVSSFVKFCKADSLIFPALSGSSVQQGSKVKMGLSIGCWAACWAWPFLYAGVVVRCCLPIKQAGERPMGLLVLLGCSVLAAVVLIVRTSGTDKRPTAILACLLWFFIYFNLMLSWWELEIQWHKPICILDAVTQSGAPKKQ